MLHEGSVRAVSFIKLILGQDPGRHRGGLEASDGPWFDVARGRLSEQEASGLHVQNVGSSHA